MCSLRQARVAVAATISGNAAPKIFCAKMSELARDAVEQAECTRPFGQRRAPRAASGESGRRERGESRARCAFESSCGSRAASACSAETEWRRPTGCRAGTG